MVLQAIRYASGQLTILDQLALPHREAWLAVRSAEEAWAAIRSMKVRGAPAIAIVAALSVAAELEQQQGAAAERANESAAAMRDFVVGRLDYLVTSRPTAVNLADAAAKLSALVGRVAEEGKDENGGSGPSSSPSAKDVADVYVAAATRMLEDDVDDNTRIGEAGARWILERAGATTGTATATGKVSVLTHCNTGSLATAGYGTALGIVRSLHASGRLARVYYGETRPYNQGSRLTGYELLHDGIPATLVTDSMAGALMAQRGPRRQVHVGRVRADGAVNGETVTAEEEEQAPLVAVIVGADRVAANGDTANKIGTYSLSVLAKHHGVDFVVAAPRTTIDLKTASGSDIVIEERKQREVVVVKGPTLVSDDGVDVNVDDVKEVSIAPSATHAWNPAFDVTPAELIDAIVTEVGVAEKKDGEYRLQPLFDTSKQKEQV